MASLKFCPQSLEKRIELEDKIERILQNPNLDDFEKNVKSAGLMEELYQYIAKPSIQLFNYVTPLGKKRSLIEEDKKTLALKFIERKNALLFIRTLRLCGQNFREAIQELQQN